MIFQSTIDTLEADIRELQQQIEAKNQRQWTDSANVGT
jgi:hypothetical protein